MEAALLILLIGLFNIYQGISLRILVSLAVLAAIFGLWLLRNTHGRWSAASSVFLAYFTVYHLAQIAVMAFAPGAVEQRLRPWQIEWLYTDVAKLTVLLSALAIISFSIAASKVPSGKPRTTNQEPHRSSYHRGLFHMGLVLLILANLLFLDALRRGGGFSVLGGSYYTFLEKVTTKDNYFHEAIYFLGMGIVLALAGAPRRLLWLPVCLFSVMAVLLLLGGNRGELFYSSLAAFILLSRRGVHLPRKAILGGLVATFLVISVVKETRGYSLDRVSTADRLVDPVDTVLELGSAARPVATVIGWTQQDEPYLLGRTYWLPFERILGRLLPFFERTSPQSDRRFVAVQTFLRTGSPMGFSILAEAFYNFGILGAVLVFGFLGALISWLDRTARNPVRLAWMGIVLFPLINSVRNSFIFVPGQIIGGAVLLWISIFIDRWWLLRRPKTRLDRKGT